MSDATDEAERDARTEIGGKINDVYDQAESTTKGDLRGSQTDEELEDAIDEILDELDELKEEFGRSEYKNANRRIRRLKRRIRELYVRDNAKAQAMIDALTEIRRIKMRDLWTTPPATAMGLDSGPHGLLAAKVFGGILGLPGLGYTETPVLEEKDLENILVSKSLCKEAKKLAWSDALDKKAENTPRYDVPELPLYHVQGISEGDAEMIQQAIGVKTIGDFVNNKLVKKTLFLHKMSREY